MPNQFTNYITLLAESVSGETVEFTGRDFVMETYEGWKAKDRWCSNELKYKAIYDV